VIAEIEKQLLLSPEHVQPSKDALFRWGNVSSSSIWCVSLVWKSHWKYPLSFLRVSRIALFRCGNVSSSL